VESFMSDYQGRVNNTPALIRALGYHAASEFRADREYALIDRFFRHDHSDEGFGKWLHSNPTVMLNNTRLSGWYWIVVHGRHDGRGVEINHYENAVRAIDLARTYGHLDASELETLVTTGANAFVQLINRVFQLIERDCLHTAKLERLSPSQPSLAPSRGIDPRAM